MGSRAASQRLALLLGAFWAARAAASCTATPQLETDGWSFRFQVEVKLSTFDAADLAGIVDMPGALHLYVQGPSYGADEGKVGVRMNMTDGVWRSTVGTTALTLSTWQRLTVEKKKDQVCLTLDELTAECSVCTGCQMYTPGPSDLTWGDAVGLGGREYLDHPVGIRYYFQSPVLHATEISSVNDIPITWYLVGITNGLPNGNGGAITPRDDYADSNYSTLGNYVKPLWGTSTYFRYECGWHLDGVLSSYVLHGQWDWEKEGFLTAPITATKISNNHQRDPRIPGKMGSLNNGNWWNDGKPTVKWPSFGRSTWTEIDGVDRGGEHFSCRNNWNGIGKWQWTASSHGNADTKFLRIWLGRTANATTTTRGVTCTTTTATTTSTSTSTASTTTASTTTITTSTMTTSTATTSTYTNTSTVTSATTMTTSTMTTSTATTSTATNTSTFTSSSSSSSTNTVTTSSTSTSSTSRTSTVSSTTTTSWTSTTTVSTTSSTSITSSTSTTSTSSTTVTATSSTTSSSSTSRTSTTTTSITSSSTTSRTVTSTTTVSTTTSSTSTTTQTEPRIFSPSALLLWFKGPEEEVREELINDTSKTRIDRWQNGAMITAIRVRPTGDRNGTFPVEMARGRRQATVEVPDSIIDSLLEWGELICEITVYDFGVLEQVISRNDEGRSADLRGSMHINFFSGNGTYQPLSNLSEPIKLRMPISESDDEDEPSCATWSEERTWWTDRDLETRSVRVGEEIVCATPHMSLFGAIIKGFLTALACTQLALLSEDGLLELIKGTWYASPMALIFWFLLFTLAAMLIAACLMDRWKEGWHDEYFLIPTGRVDPEAGEEAAEAQPPASSLSVFGLICACCAESGVLRDIIDDFLSRWFECFGEVRSLLEGVCGEFDWSGAGEHGGVLARALTGMTGALLANSACRRASATLGISMDMVAIVTDDEMVGEFLASRTTTIEQETTPSDSTRKREKAWIKLHTMVFNEIDRQYHKPTRWRSLPCAFMHVFCVANPLVSLYTNCALWTRAQRVLAFCCEILGAIMISSVFFETSGDLKIKKNKNVSSCDVEGVGEEIGRIIAIALGSILLSSIPASLMSMLRERSFQQFDSEGCSEWRKRLRIWRFQDMLFWCIGCVYCAFCILFIALFLSNVDIVDHFPLGLSGAISLVEDLMVIPFAVAMAVPMMTAALVSLLSSVKGVHKHVLIHMARLERENQGNWRRGCVSI